MDGNLIKTKKQGYYNSFHIFLEPILIEIVPLSLGFNGVSMVDYQEYIQSPEWDKKRKQRLAVDKYTCQNCGVTGKPLDVHHKNYARLGRERMGDLESLCRPCHDLEHEAKNRLIVFSRWLVDRIKKLR